MPFAKTCGKCKQPLKRYYIVGKSQVVCRACYDAINEKQEQRTGDESI